MVEAARKQKEKNDDAEAMANLFCIHKSWLETCRSIFASNDNLKDDGTKAAIEYIRRFDLSRIKLDVDLAEHQWDVATTRIEDRLWRMKAKEEEQC